MSNNKAVCTTSVCSWWNEEKEDKINLWEQLKINMERGDRTQSILRSFHYFVEGIKICLIVGFVKLLTRMRCEILRRPARRIVIGKTSGIKKKKKWNR